MIINVKDEYSKLKTVVVSSANYYNQENIAINNETIRSNIDNNIVPRKEIILKEQKCFWDYLNTQGINVLIADQVDEAKGQMFTRDLAFVINDKFFISSMKKENRRLAINGWRKIINQIDAGKIIEVPSDIYLEGGDVIVSQNIVYVGISQRTTMKAVEFLKNTLGPSYQVIPLKLKPTFLHLDVVFTIINPNLALIYKEGIKEESYKLLSKYQKIEVSKEEQFELATNVFVIDKKTIIINRKHQRLKKELEKYNLNVILLDIKETAKLGGAFRCTTCPLERINF